MSQDIRIKIATNVKYNRESLGYTREDLSLTLGFDNSYIGKLEKCKVNITIDRLCMIADFFRLEVYELLK